MAYGNVDAMVIVMVTNNGAMVANMGKVLPCVESKQIIQDVVDYRVERRIFVRQNKTKQKKINKFTIEKLAKLVGLSVLVVWLKPYALVPVSC